VAGQLDELVRPELFIGRAPAQVEEFLKEVAGPAIERHGGGEAGTVTLKV